MNTQSLKFLICFGLITLYLTFHAFGEIRASENNSVVETNQSFLDWELASTVGAYREAGHTNPAWDAPAIRALTSYAEAQNQPSDISLGKAWTESVVINCGVAIKAGCDDPLVRYLYAHFYLRQTNSPLEMATTFCDVAVDLQKSSYPPIRKFYAAVRAVDACRLAHGSAYANTMPVVQDISASLGQNILAVLRDKAAPPEEVYSSSSDFLEYFEGQPNNYAEAYSIIASPLFANWGDKSVSWLLKGKAYIDMAWNARGNGFARNITDEAAKTFQDDLAVAETALDRAWELNPHDARIPTEMLSVELGQGQGRDRMELWFHRAMKIDPDNYDACTTRLSYIDPNYYGSIQEMLDFGRECVTNSAWGGRVPLVLVDVRARIYNQFIDKTQQTNYWRQPDVWPDIKSAYDRFFELNPNALADYKDYAWYANKAGQWETFLRLAPKIRDVDYYQLGGRKRFELLVRHARKMINDQSRLETPTSTPSLPDNVTNMPGVKILSVKFGAGTNVVDVTAKVIELLNANTNGFMANWHTLKANPTPRRNRKITVQYDLNGSNYVLTIHGGSYLNSEVLMINARESNRGSP